ncbi:MAG: Asp-tRNA(Asn)/Glu-tRNA(Gln) amidotransferase subunit GatC [Spirochaetes bacterium]|nr:Asp-tRNA(Asn)/Glu-tRNA(Gln) amidotransferase subunit GatC [Spirochaetota bacterium]
MSISKKEVKYVSDLSRIKLEEKELEKFTSQLDKILEYIEQLKEVDTEQVQVTSHSVELQNVVREDKKTKASLTNDEATGMAPDKEKEFFRVPRIIE